MLEKSNAIRGKSDLARQLGTYNHVINAILKGDRQITVKQIGFLLETFNVNANFLFGLSDEPFREGGLSSMDTLNKESMDFGSRSNITLVSDKVKAGYAIGHQEADYLKDLPKFSLPNVLGSNLIAFEISGDSMMPTLTQGDLVVCEPLERDMAIYENHVYVVVTDVLVAKRVQQIKQGSELLELRLISDNKVYQPYSVSADEITQLLKVKCRVTTSGVR